MFAQLRKPVNKPLPRKLCIVTTGKFIGTVRKITEPLAGIGITLETWAWDRFLSETRLPFAAWALTDFDRIHVWQTELAASRHDALIAAGAVVMNDPRRFLTRAPLIRTLHALGIVRYTCWLPAFGETREKVHRR